MREGNLLKLFIFSLIISACNSATTPVSTGPACSLDMQAAWAEYDRLMGDDNPNNDPKEPPRECNLPTREPSSNLVVNEVLRDFGPEDEKKMKDALARLEIVINSVEFRERVLAHEFNGQLSFNDNDGMTNEEIYEKLMTGHEDLLPVNDQEIDLDMTLYYSNNSTVGYTYPDTIKIWVNDKFFSGYSLGQVAANAVHEWTHKVGFTHSFRNNASRPYSVPYAIGSIVREMVDNL